MTSDEVLSPSRYNFAVYDSLGDGVAVYNAFSGALLALQGVDARSLATALCTRSGHVNWNEQHDHVTEALVSGGFLHSPKVDELATIHERFSSARENTPAVITITTTMDCNLGCYYCYEERSGDALTTNDVGAIVAHAARLIDEAGISSLHVDWYGGEPLLNLTFLEEASLAIQGLCASKNIPYVASVISNGTQWPQDAPAFIRRHAIRQVQISFDGMNANHDKRRRYRKGRGAPGESSFAKAVELVDALCDVVRVDVRFNMDRKNCVDLIPFIRFARSRGWFKARFPAVFQPARLAMYSENSSFLREHEISLDEFDELRKIARDELNGVAVIEESETPDGFPYPRTSVCAALAAQSVVIGADRNAYRCGLQVGEEHRHIGPITSFNEPGDANTFPDRTWWDNFDPTTLPTCSQCSFLPVCWGGCPKKHLENDVHALQEQGRFWRHNLSRMIARRAGFAQFAPSAYSLSDQFRDSVTAQRTHALNSIEIALLT
jgi:uncharacterized protein